MWQQLRHCGCRASRWSSTTGAAGLLRGQGGEAHGAHYSRGKRAGLRACACVCVQCLGAGVSCVAVRKQSRGD